MWLSSEIMPGSRMRTCGGWLHRVALGAASMAGRFTLRNGMEDSWEGSSSGAAGHRAGGQGVLHPHPLHQSSRNGWLSPAASCSQTIQPSHCRQLEFCVVFPESFFSPQKLSECFSEQGLGWGCLCFWLRLLVGNRMLRHSLDLLKPPWVLVPLISAILLSPQSPSHKSKRQQQELIAELRRRQVKDNRHVYEGKDGAIEDIITGKRYFLLVARRDPTDPAHSGPLPQLATFGQIYEVFK